MLLFHSCFSYLFDYVSYSLWLILSGQRYLGIYPLIHICAFHLDFQSIPHWRHRFVPLVFISNFLLCIFCLFSLVWLQIFDSYLPFPANFIWLIVWILILANISSIFALNCIILCYLPVLFFFKKNLSIIFWRYLSSQWLFSCEFGCKLLF